MNNAVFGKMLESLRKHQDVKLVLEERKFKKLVNKPNFKSFKIFSEDLVSVHMSKTEIKLVKPTYVGFSILDFSKTFMYDFYYKKMVTKYGSRVKLLMTDTDSFILHIQTPDIYRDMLEDVDAYDTCDYPQNHFACSNKNKKVLGKMKDELNGRPVQKFVGLRPKMYALLEADGHEKKTATGISKRVTETDILVQFILGCVRERCRKRLISIQVSNIHLRVMLRVQLNQVNFISFSN